MEIQTDETIFEILNNVQDTKYIILYTVISICILAFIMNAFVLFIVLQLQTKTIDTKLVASIATIDLLSSVFTILFDIPLIVTKFNLFYSQWFRILDGTFLNGLHASSLLLIFLLSLERYLLITKSIKFKGSIWFFIASLCIFLLCFLYILSAIFKKIRLMPSGVYCQLLMWEDSISMTVYLTISCLLATCGLMMTYCYLRIIYYTKKVKNEIKIIANHVRKVSIPSIGEDLSNHIHENFNQAIAKNSDKTKRRCIIFIIAYNLCFIPFVVALLYELFKGNSNITIDCLNPISFAATSCCNPILSLLLHEPTRNRAVYFFNGKENKLSLY